MGIFNRRRKAKPDPDPWLERELRRAAERPMPDPAEQKRRHDTYQREEVARRARLRAKCGLSNHDRCLSH